MADPGAFCAVAVVDEWVTPNTTNGDFFSMRSGTPHQARDEPEELGNGRVEVIEKFRSVTLAPLRNRNLFTNFGLTAGVEPVARSCGVTLDQLSAQRIYEPLGMTRTTSVFDEFMDQDNRATLHMLSDEDWVANGNRAEQAQTRHSLLRIRPECADRLHGPGAQRLERRLLPGCGDP